jgi:sporulation protein YlmC with PRC-barrel domain
MMKLSYEDQIKARTVIDASGRSIGQVDALYLDSESAGSGVRVAGIRVRLHAQIADALGVEHGVFHPPVIDVPADALQAIGDAVILNVAVSSLAGRRAAGSADAR